MSGKKILLNLGYVGDDLIAEAEEYRFETGRGKRPLLLAALIAAALLLVGCAVAYALNVGSLRLGQRQVTRQRFSEDGSEYLGEETAVEEVLTRAGIAGSPEYEAAREWYDFLQSYDPDKAIFRQAQDSLPDFPAEYASYNLYTREMQEKLEEILEKYRLKPAGAGIPFRTPKLLYEALGIPNVLRSESGATMDTFAAALYESGTLTVDGNLYLSPKEWVRTTVFYTPKGYFNENVACLSDIENWTQENYTTSSGNRVLLLFEKSGLGWAFYDGKENLVSVRAEPKDLDQLKGLADAIDLDLVPTLPESYKTEETNTGGQIGDYHFELKEVHSDGYSAWVTVAVTAPENVKLLGGLTTETEILTHGNEVNFWEPAVKDWRLDSCYGTWEEDGDGKDNTADYVLKTFSAAKDMPFGPGKVWKLYWEDLCVQSWDEEIGDFHKETVAQGTWSVDVAFQPDTTGDLELIQDSVSTRVVTGWDLQGNAVTAEADIISFRLHPYSASISYGDKDAAWDPLSQGDILVVMGDGSKITLSSVIAGMGVQCLEPDRPIDLGQVECVILADGKRLGAAK